MKIGSHVGLALRRWNVLVYDRKHRDMNRIAQGAVSGSRVSKPLCCISE